MCRLMALSKAEKVTTPDMYIFGMMMILSSREGNTHGCGIATPSDGKKFYWWKSGHEAEEVMFGEWWNKFKPTMLKSHTLVGHTRQASALWRKTGTNAKVELRPHAHPHLCGNVLVFHNGLFKDYDVIKSQLKKEITKEEYTDSMAFTMLLGKLSRKSLGPDEIRAALKLSGEAEYSLMLQHVNDAPEVIRVVRGARPLYQVETSYGWLINTGFNNLRDLAGLVNPALASFGYPLLEMGTATLMKEFTLYYLDKGVLTEGESLADVKEVSDPPKVPQSHAVYSNSVGRAAIGSSWAGVGFGFQQTSSQPIAGIDGVEVFNRGVGIARLLQMIPVVATEDDLRLTMAELTNVTRGSLFLYDSKEITELCKIMEWAWETYPELAPSTEKDEIWQRWKLCLARPQEAYEVAKVKVRAGIDPPYWHNTLTQLKGLEP